MERVTNSFCLPLPDAVHNVILLTFLSIIGQAKLTLSEAVCDFADHPNS